MTIKLTKKRGMGYNLICVFASLFIYLGLSATIYNVDSYLVHLILSTAFLMVAAVFLNETVLKHYLGEKSLRLVLGMCLIQMIVGVTHYCLLMNPEYFMNVDKLDHHEEYALTIQCMRYVATTWREQGILAPLSVAYMTEVNHPYLYGYMGIQYYFAGPTLLGLCSFNTIHSLFTSTFMALIAKKKGYSSETARKVFMGVMLMPLLLINSHQYRDIVGICLITLAIYLMVETSDRIVLNTILLPISCALMYMMRYPYILVPIFLYAYYRVHYTKNYILKIGLVLMCVLSVFVAYGMGMFADVETFNPNYLNISAGSIIIGPVLALMGGFPWTNILRVDYWEYLIFEYFQAVVNIALWFTVLYKKCVLRMKEKSNDMLLVALMFFAMAAFNNSRHITYISVGSVFLFPFALEKDNKHYSKFSFGAIIVLAIMFMVIASLLYELLGLTGSGLFQDMTK